MGTPFVVVQDAVAHATLLVLLRGWSASADHDGSRQGDRRRMPVTVSRRVTVTFSPAVIPSGSVGSLRQVTVTPAMPPKQSPAFVAPQLSARFARHGPRRRTIHAVTAKKPRSVLFHRAGAAIRQPGSCGTPPLSLSLPRKGGGNSGCCQSRPGPALRSILPSSPPPLWGRDRERGERPYGYVCAGMRGKSRTTRRAPAISGSYPSLQLSPARGERARWRLRPEPARRSPRSVHASAPPHPLPP